MSDTELFRLASLIGCEPEKEAKHRQDLLDYVEAHYQPQAAEDADVKTWMESLGFLYDDDSPPSYFRAGLGYVSTGQAQFFYEAFRTERQHSDD